MSLYRGDVVPNNAGEGLSQRRRNIKVFFLNNDTFQIFSSSKIQKNIPFGEKKSIEIF